MTEILFCDSLDSYLASTTEKKIGGLNIHLQNLQMTESYQKEDNSNWNIYRLNFTGEKKLLKKNSGMGYIRNWGRSVQIYDDYFTFHLLTGGYLGELSEDKKAKLEQLIQEILDYIQKELNGLNSKAVDFNNM